MSTDTAQTCPSPVRASRTRIVLGVCLALGLGLGLATMGSTLLESLARATPAGAETLPALAQTSDDTLLIGQLGAELNDLAPAAGTPLGTLSEQPAD